MKDYAAKNRFTIPPYLEKDYHRRRRVAFYFTYRVGVESLDSHQ